MRFEFSAALLLLPSLVLGANFTRSAKRGLIYIPNAATPEDNGVWTSFGPALTWYYNYGYVPSPAISAAGLQFVPMLFGSTTGTVFKDAVTALIKAGTNITYVLGFNEPDGTTSTGGSSIAPAVAAETWKREMEPLRQLGVKLGAPAVTGSPNGFVWLTDFMSACNGGCTFDFVTAHWYGNFQGLAGHLGQKRAAYPNLTIWITEYAYDQQDLTTTQDFFNTTVDYFDRLDFVTHYSYFGSFRSSKSNVGPNVAMLDGYGKLTDIGSWYMGGAATGVIPTTKGSAAARAGIESWALIIAVAAGLWVL